MLEGIENFLESHDIASLFVYCFPDYTVSPLSKTLKDFVLTQDVVFNLLGHFKIMGQGRVTKIWG
jgi:hypothetical protein